MTPTEYLTASIKLTDELVDMSKAIKEFAQNSPEFERFLRRQNEITNALTELHQRYETERSR